MATGRNGSCSSNVNETSGRGDSHGDIVFWPLVVLAQYLLASDDAAVLDERGGGCAKRGVVLRRTAERRRAQRRCGNTPNERCTHSQAGDSSAPRSPAYGHGDWNDSLQPRRPA